MFGIILLTKSRTNAIAIKIALSVSLLVFVISKLLLNILIEILHNYDENNYKKAYPKHRISFESL